VRCRTGEFLPVEEAEESGVDADGGRFAFEVLAGRAVSAEHQRHVESVDGVDDVVETLLVAVAAGVPQ